MRRTLLSVVAWVASILCLPFAARGEDGYELWLRYRPMADHESATYRPYCREIVIPEPGPILASAGQELRRALAGMFGAPPPMSPTVTRDGAIVLVVRGGPVPGAFRIDSTTWEGRACTVIAGDDEAGALYGTFEFLRRLQVRRPVSDLHIAQRPGNPLRMVNHWGTSTVSPERSYGGPTIFRWDRLPELDGRYIDYARMLASVGINATVPNSVNTDRDSVDGWRLIGPEGLPKLAALADVLRPYGIRLFASINFRSPILLGKLATADPCDPDVRRWWADKAAEIYAKIPDFGGFLIKADSEGEPGPQAYHRTPAEGANMLAAALRPHGGLLIWRAFVYGKARGDRAREAYDLFHGLDGHFAENVLLQIKNGPLDFQVREPVSPLLGAMPRTNSMLELQIAQEYTGRTTHLCFLVPQWKEVFEFDTHARGPGSTVAKVVSGTLFGNRHGGVAGVINIGSDRNWTGHYLAQANTYGFGRLAWDPQLTADQIAEEWVRMAFGHDDVVVRTVSRMLLDSWRIYERYTSPLGLGVMCDSNHFDPAPEKRVRFHRADAFGVGYDRTQATGSGYTGQYHPPAASLYESIETCPDEYLLWFHHVPYSHRLRSGKTVIQHIYDAHFDGVEEAAALRRSWLSLKGRIDDERFVHVLTKLDAQVLHAKRWRDAINGYFFRLSGISDNKGRQIGG